MKKIFTMLILGLLVFGKVFAADLVKIFDYESEMETYNVYLDFDAREPFYIKCESIEYFLLLQDIYDEVEVCLCEGEDEDWKDWKVLWDFAAENNCYAICIENENCNIDFHINIDGTVTAYAYRGLKNQINEE